MYSEVVKYFRKHNHLTQEELASKLNIKRHTVCDWESGRTEPSIYFLKLIAETFNITVDYLVGLDNTDANLDHVILQKFHAHNELEHELLQQVVELTPFQQERLKNIIVSLKEFNRGE